MRSWQVKPALVLSTVIVLVSCSTGDPGVEVTGTTSGAPTTSVSPTTTAAPTTSSTSAAPVATSVSSFGAAGPFEVGVTTVEPQPDAAIEVYYPATDAAIGQTDTYELTTFLPLTLTALLPAGTESGYTINAARDGAASPDGPFPLVLYSHGFGAFRSVSSELLRHLASWGFVVASADHPSRNMAAQLGAVPENAGTAIEDLREARAALEAMSDGDGPLSGSIDSNRVVISGHSAGGRTVEQFAGDDGVVGIISMAAGAASSPVNVPALFMTGDLDTIVPPMGSTTSFEASTSSAWLWTIKDAGHLVFTDLCEHGDGEGGLVGLAEAAGIASFIPPQLKALATDGCEPPSRPVRDVWPAINHATVAFARWATGLDSEPGALDSYEADPTLVTIEADG